MKWLKTRQVKSMAIEFIKKADYNDKKKQRKLFETETDLYNVKREIF